LSVKKEVFEWFKSILIAILIVVGFRYFIGDHYRVDGSSMEPTIHSGERIIVNKLLYKLRHPMRGEIVILHAPEGKDYIKRIIALPGETIRVKGDKVYINDAVIKEPYLAEAIKKAHKGGYDYNTFDYPYNGKAEVVPKDKVFVMGDNRSYSKDSRAIGYIKYSDIVGRAEFVIWPYKNIDRIDH
jgi:signal peptidase I